LGEGRPGRDHLGFWDRLDFFLAAPAAGFAVAALGSGLAGRRSSANKASTLAADVTRKTFSRLVIDIPLS
jgi:hypothetical protein